VQAIAVIEQVLTENEKTAERAVILSVLVEIHQRFSSGVLYLLLLKSFSSLTTSASQAW